MPKAHCQVYQRLGLAALFCLLACAIWPRLAIAQYRFDHWTADNGLRFDGVRFTVFNKGNSPGIISNRFLQLYEDGQGDLWASTESSGLTRLHDGRFTTYPKENVVPNGAVFSLGDDRQGHLLLFNDAQMFRWTEERFQPVDTAQFPTGKPAELELLQHLAYGRVDQTYSFVGAGQMRSLKWADGAGFLGVPMQDRQGRIWFGSFAGLYTEAQGQLSRSLLLGSELAERPTWLVAGRQPLQALSRSADGGLWLTDIETRQPQLVAHLPPESLSGSPARAGDVFTAYGDREGNLWLGTLHNGSPSRDSQPGTSDCWM
jgi:ligand-binding sensor domain-containing protein